MTVSDPKEKASVINLVEVTRRFGPVAAVDHVSVDLMEGEFFALLGPSGCGKTTLLRLIAGFELPDHGSVLLDGRDITRLRANRRPINLMFQSYALFPHMSVKANIAYGLEMERLSKPEIARRVAEVLDMVELGDLAARKPDRLSGGQRQRVALARALVKRPRVLLLDEPLGALDKKLREQMQIELKRLQHELGITFVVVTHDQEEALVMADRIALMKDGKIVQLDQPRALYERPGSRFVADFIGVTNFIEGTLSAEGLSVKDQGLLRAEKVTSHGEPASLAVRPERMSLSFESPSAEYDCLKGVIADIAYHGQDLSVHVAAQGVVGPVLVRVPSGDPDCESLRPGQPVWCRWRPEHASTLIE